MNKYKMITICSLTIVCILILSLLLPLTTSANDKESIELKMHHENSVVTVNIAVNSELYSGVVCKYIEIENVLEYDNLSTQTKENGKTINLNKTEDDKYITTIENITKRYVVVYVSIGNCDICDYIDCKSNSNNQLSNENATQEANQNAPENNNQNTEEANNNAENNSQGNDLVQASENSNNGAMLGSNSEFETIEEAIKEEPNSEKNQQVTEQQKKPEDEVQSTQSNPTQIASAEVNSFVTGADKNSSTNNESSNKNTQTTSTVSKDFINLDSFKEIESSDTVKFSSTVENDIPQTGESDGIKIMGIIIFSIISIGSFYKYKKSK